MYFVTSLNYSLTDRTGHDQTWVSDKVSGFRLVGSGPVGSGRARVVEFRYNLSLEPPAQT